MQDKKQESILKTTIPQTTHINRVLVSVIVAVAVLLVAVAIVSALSRSPQKTTNTRPTTQNLTTAVSEVVTALPQNYQDVDKIKQYQPNDKTAKISPEVQQEMAILHQQQQALEQRLAELSARSPSSAQDDEKMQQAKNSGLFFPGSAPPTPEYHYTPDSSNNASTDKNNNTDKTDSGFHNTPYSQQNMQSQKIDFLKADEKDSSIYDPHSLQKPASPYEVQAGTLLPAELITGVNTSLPGDVVAQIKENIYDSVTGRFLLIPKGSKLLGQYDSQVSYGQERTLLAFTRIIRPDGSSILLNKLSGADMMGQSGIEGDVNNHWMRVIGAATLSTILSMGTGVAADNVANQNSLYPNTAQKAALGAADSISQTGEDLTNNAMNIQPTITIPAGYEFNVIVNKDIILAPYQQENML
ncbi:MAG: TrbI/VirB10 family protein [Pseudomonadota bacterium]